MGRVSGIGWGLGYLGGIPILLLIVALRGTEFTADDVRFSMLLCGAWTAVFAIPIFVTLRDRRPDVLPEKIGIAGAYRELFQSIKRVWDNSRHLLYFLIASAIFHDGLAGVFTFGAILAGGTFGFSPGEVIIFGIVANVTAGVSTMLFGMMDDKLGPKNVIMFSLISMVVLGLFFFVHDKGQIVFWICGLLLTVFVGPAQSASRSCPARLMPDGQSGEIFGLYATTGRAVSFLSSTAWAVSIGIAIALSGGGTEDSVQYAGILGIVIVLFIGLLVLIPVKDPTRTKNLTV